MLTDWCRNSVTHQSQPTGFRLKAGAEEMSKSVQTNTGATGHLKQTYTFAPSSSTGRHTTTSQLCCYSREQLIYVEGFECDIIHTGTEVGWRDVRNCLFPPNLCCWRRQNVVWWFVGRISGSKLLCVWFLYHNYFAQLFWLAAKRCWLVLVHVITIKFNLFPGANNV